MKKIQFIYPYFLAVAYSPGKKLHPGVDNMRFLILLFLIFQMTISYAQEDRADLCYTRMTLDHSASSRVFQIDASDIEEFEILNEETSSMLVDKLLQKEISCQLKELVSKNAQVSSCHQLRYSNVCQVFTKIGYFIVQRASYGSFDYNLIWTRWD